MILLLWLLSAFLPLAWAPSESTDSWERFRGPNGTGVAEAGNLPVHFGPDRNLVWKIGLPPGHSSPVVTADRIFLTAEEDGKLLTICLNRADGRLLWKQESPRSRTEKLDQRNHSASPSPVVDESAVYVFFPDFGLLSYGFEGGERWRTPMGPFRNIYGMGASPVLADGKVILVCDQQTDSFIVGVDKKDGIIRWKTDRPEAKSGHSTPVVYRTPGGEEQIIVPGSFLLTAYSPQTGEKLWWVGGLSVEMKSTPALSGDTVYINGYATPLNQPDQMIQVEDAEAVFSRHDSDGDDRLSPDEAPDKTVKAFFPFIDLESDGLLDRNDWDFYRAAMASKNGMLAIRLGGSGDMTGKNLIWQYHRSVPQLPSPLLYKGVLSMINDGGVATSFNPADGTVKSRGRIKGAIDNYYASPVAGDDKIFLVSETGKVAVVKADGSLEVLAVNDLDSRCYATPAIAGGRLYIRTVDALYCFGT